MDNLQKKRPTNRLGRKIGSPNKWQGLKDKLVDAGRQDKLVGIWEEMLDGNKKERLEALKIACAILPREDKIQHQIAQLVISKQVIANPESTSYKMDYVNCPKCSHSIDLRSMNNGETSYNL